jgi:hypothetical protein
MLRRMWGKRNPHTLAGNGNWYNHSGKQYGSSSKTKNSLSILRDWDCWSKLVGKYKKGQITQSPCRVSDMFDSSSLSKRSNEKILNRGVRDIMFCSSSDPDCCVTEDKVMLDQKQPIRTERNTPMWLGTSHKGALVPWQHLFSLFQLWWVHRSYVITTMRNT